MNSNQGHGLDACPMRRIRKSAGTSIAAYSIQPPQEGTKTVVSMTPLSDGSYFNAAFLQITPESKPLRLSEPDSFLMVYTSGPGLQGTLMIARVDTSGTIVWKIDTGVDRVEWRQVLSDASRIAFIGRKPRIPDKVAEPILVIVNIQSGAITTSSLWQ